MEALNARAIVGKPTLATLVPSEDSNMDSERPASAHRTERLWCAFPGTASSGSAINVFNMNYLLLYSFTYTTLFSGDSENRTVGNIFHCLAWRKMHDLHFIRAFDATIDLPHS
jgi:hypothetical protein